MLGSLITFLTSKSILPDILSNTNIHLLKFFASYYLTHFNANFFCQRRELNFSI